MKTGKGCGGSMTDRKIGITFRVKWHAKEYNWTDEGISNPEIWKFVSNLCSLFLIYIMNRDHLGLELFPPQALAFGNETGAGQYVDFSTQLRRIWEIYEGQAFQIAGRIAARWCGTAVKRKCLILVLNSQTCAIGKARARLSSELGCLWVSCLIFLFFLNA